MDKFAGTWRVYHKDNAEEFFKAVGAPEMVVKMCKDVKPEITVETEGNKITYTTKTSFGDKVNVFTLGEECEMCSADGTKIKATMTEENGKLITKSGKFICVCEIQGDEMVDTFSAGSVTFIRKCKRV